MIKDKSIFIKNIYYMLSYAFTTLNQGGYEDVATEEFENIHNLFAAILAKGIGRQLKQGLYREYQNRKEDVAVVRGKIDMPGTIQNRLARKRVLTCEYDELSENNLLNQILKTTVMLLLRHSRVDQEYKNDLKKEMLFFSNVDTIDPTTIHWSSIRFQRNNNTYRMLISLCQLVLEGMLVSTDSGEYRLASFVDEQRMNRLYEKFILEYYRTEFPVIKAEASQIKWMLDDDNGSMLPIMKSDITLSYGDKILIIDAKYYAHTTQVQFDKHSLHSGNLYQIFTYVKNKEAELKELSHEVAGMLLYAKTDEEIQPDNEYWMSGNKIGVKTLDLSGDFDSIEKQLYAIAKDFFGDVVDTHFYLNARGCAGVGVRNGNLGFMLLAGSKISQREPSSTCPEHIHRLREEYSDKIQNGVLMENVLFHSASAAASFLMMTNINGNIAWKTKEGTSLGEYRRKY